MYQYLDKLTENLYNYNFVTKQKGLVGLKIIILS